MVQTRLINLETFKLEAFEIREMPPYAAISHVWSEELFPVSALHDMEHTHGMKMVRTVLQLDSASSSTRYCWIDGYCIRQDDEDEILIQIPLMADIYRKAELVIVTVRHEFTFTQADWNAGLHGCGKWLDDDLWEKRYLDTEARKELLNIARVRSLLTCIDMINEIASLPWVSSALLHYPRLSSYSSQELSHLDYPGVYLRQPSSVHWQ
jgi:Heterokaryon incompatibility protein (HET)